MSEDAPKISAGGAVHVVEPSPSKGPSPTNVAALDTNQSRQIVKGKVKLDVGGFKFTTSRATLCRFPGMFLEVMFSGRHDYPTEIDEEDGSYFIDRDGRHFHHVLNFLRIGSVVSLPDSDGARDELAAEADFYGLEGLASAIRQPQVDIASHLTPEMAQIREEEDRLRRAFAKRQAGIFDSHHGLISLFADPRGRSSDVDCNPPIKYQVPEIAETDVLCMTLRDNDVVLKKGQDLATCKSLDDFKTEFNKQHANILNRLDDVLRSENIIIAGGSVLHALTSGKKVRNRDWWRYDDSDIDLFIYGTDSEGANTIARRVYDALAVNNERWGIMRSAGVINFHQEIDQCIHQKIQVVLRIYDSPTEILFGFDVDCCCCAFDGRDVWLTKRCLLALKTGINVVNPIHAWPSKASYELRLAKYAKRGFSVLIPGLDMSRVDHGRILPAEMGKLKGLARLLKVSQEMESAAATLTPDSCYRPPSTYSSYPRKVNLVPALKKEAFTCREPAEFLASGCGWYDELGFDVIVPGVMCATDSPCGFLWYDCMCRFPFSSEDIRNEAWNEILDCEDAPGKLPCQLLNAWDTGKRSREYLNGEMESFDLNSIYYSEAYRK